MKKLFFLGIILAVVLLGLSGCTGENNKGLMEGAWSLDSTETTPGKRVLGDGNFTLTYEDEGTILSVVFEFYSGIGTIGGVDYTLGAMYIPDMQEAAIFLWEPGEDSDPDSIDLEAYSYTGGKTMQGTYTGDGVYDTGQPKDIGQGTFVATQN